jgi:hypothetical protein
LIVAHDDYIIHKLHPGNLKPGPLLAAGHFVMGLFKKNGEPKGRWGLQKATKLPKGRCSAIKANGAPLRQMWVPKGKWGAIKANVGAERQMGCH